MPIIDWLHYADHPLAPIRRSSSGSYMPVADTADKALMVLARRHRLAHLFGIVTPDAALAELSLTLRG